MQEWRDRLMTLYRCASCVPPPPPLPPDLHDNSEPHRHYHTLTHVSDLLAQLHEHREVCISVAAAAAVATH